MSFRRFGSLGSKIINDTKSQEFYALINNKKEGYLSYRYLNKDTIDYYHTEIPNEEFRGTGLAADLAKTAFDFALNNGLKMKLTCEYLQHKLTKFDDKYKKIVI